MLSHALFRNVKGNSSVQYIVCERLAICNIDLSKMPGNSLGLSVLTLTSSKTVCMCLTSRTAVLFVHSNTEQTFSLCAFASVVRYAKLLRTFSLISALILKSPLHTISQKERKIINRFSKQ